jgi:hypothetical protein
MANVKKQLTLQKLIQEVIQEVGDLANIEPYRYTYLSNIPAGTFITTEGEEVLMFMEKIDLPEIKIPTIFKQTGRGLEEKNQIPIVQIGYTVQELATQARKTNLKELYRILKTLLNFVNRSIPAVVNKYGEDTLFIIASQSKSTEDFEPSPQKDALYREIFYKNLPKDQFRTAELNLNGKPTILFQKIKSRK